MPNLIKVMDVTKETISQLSFTNAESFMLQVITAVSNPETAIIMYQADLPKAMLTILSNSVKAQNNLKGTTIRIEESKVLHPYEKSSGFGFVDTLNPEYWDLRNVDTTEKDIQTLDSLYHEVQFAIDNLVKASGINKSQQVVFYLRTKNQKK